MIEFKEITTGRTAWFEWDLDLSFEVKKLTRADFMQARKAGERYAKLKHIDKDEAVALQLGRFSIINWRGLKYRHLPELCDNVGVPDGRGDEMIPYDEEARDEILLRMSLDLSNFLGKAQEEFLSVIEAASEKNSGRGSNGGVTLGD